MNRREALSTLSRNAALGALAGTAVVAVACQPVEAPAAEPISDELADAIRRHRAALARADAAQLARRPFEWAEFAKAKADAAARASFKATNEAFDRACEGLFEALDDVVAVPIHTLADMRGKAVYLAEVMPGSCDHNDTMAALLASMGGDEAGTLHATVAPPVADDAGSAA